MEEGCGFLSVITTGSHLHNAMSLPASSRILRSLAFAFNLLLTVNSPVWCNTLATLSPLTLLNGHRLCAYRRHTSKQTRVRQKLLKLHISFEWEFILFYGIRTVDFSMTAESEGIASQPVEEKWATDNSFSGNVGCEYCLQMELVNLCLKELEK